MFTSYSDLELSENPNNSTHFLLTQVRGMQRPPHGVKLVMEAVCIMKSVKPKKIPGEKPGTKVDDYWEPGKGLLQDPNKFLEGLFKYDKVELSSTLF